MWWSWAGGDVLEQRFRKDGLWKVIVSLTWELVAVQIVRPHLRLLKVEKLGGGACGLTRPPAPQPILRLGNEGLDGAEGMESKRQQRARRGE